MGSTLKTKTGREFSEFDWEEPTVWGLRLVRHFFIDNEKVSKRKYIKELKKERSRTDNPQA